MKGKVLLLTILFLLLSSFAFAIFPENETVAYYKVEMSETNQTLADGSTYPPYTSLSNRKAPSTLEMYARNGVILHNYSMFNGSYRLGGTNEYLVINNNDSLNFGTSESFSISLWAKFNAITDEYFLYKKTLEGYFIYSYSSGALQAGARDGGTAGCYINTAGGAITTSGWQHIVYTRNTATNTATLYVNNVSKGSVTNADCSDSTANTGHFLLGTDLSGYADADFNGLSIYNKSLSTTEISEIYAEGYNYNPFTSQNFTITVVDNSTLTSVLNFTANVSGTIYQSNNTGSIITSINDSQLVNITISSPNYFNNTYLNYNTSSNLNAMLDPEPLLDFDLLTPNNSITTNSSYNITWTEAISPTGKNVSYNISIYYPNATLKESFNTSLLYYNLDLSSYDANTYNISVYAEEDSTGVNYTHASLLYVNKMNYIYFLDGYNSSPLVGGNVTITLPSSTEESYTTDSEGKINFESYRGLILQNGTYGITYEDDTGYETPVTFSYSATTLPFNLTYNISRTTININIFDRKNGSTFLKNSTIIFQGVGNVSTNTGNYTFDGISLSNGQYTILVKSEGYFTEQRVINFSNQESMNLSFYLLNTSDPSAITITVQVSDTTLTKIENAQVNMLEYDLATLSYISVSQGYTNSEGEVIFLAELNDKTYKFEASKYINGFLRTGDSGDEGTIFRDEIVAGEPITFEKQTVSIILTGFEEFMFSSSLYLRYNITENFNESTNISTISVDFSTTDGSDVTMCIEFLSGTGSNKTSELQKCDTGNAGTLTPTTPFLLNRSKSYELQVYAIDNNNAKTVLQTFRYASITSFQEVLRGYAIVKPFILALWIIILGVALFSGNLVLGGVLGIILALIELFLFPNILTASGSTLKILICIQVIFFGRKKEDFT